MTAQLGADPSTHPTMHPTTHLTTRLAARPQRRVRASGGCDPAGRRPRHPRAACDGTPATAGATGPARHDAGALAARFAHQLVEVLTGARPSGQLMRHTSLDGYGQLASLVRAGALRRGGPADRPRLGPVHDRSPSPDAVEACVRVDLGRRHHMVAFRLEQRGPAGQWQCTAVEAR
ncbi:Rv3235 family protein [Kitasatospora sp. NPDC059648]|uniref:Rv3235 family protein n=1 Tax=Kitasatospora sp. NPDC059648 TaxID=3346894 RepID=UPI0036B55874